MWISKHYFMYGVKRHTVHRYDHFFFGFFAFDLAFLMNSIIQANLLRCLISVFDKLFFI